MPGRRHVGLRLWSEITIGGGGQAGGKRLSGPAFTLFCMDDPRALLRHTLATLAYRAAKTLRGAPASFAEYRAGPGSRTPVEILAHMGDLLDWALHLAQ